MVDKFVPPPIEYVLTRRNIPLSVWLTDQGIHTPQDLVRVCETLQDQYTFSEQWKRRATLAVLDRLMSLPVSIGVAPVEPPALKEEVMPAREEKEEEESVSGEATSAPPPSVPKKSARQQIRKTPAQQDPGEEEGKG